jgi:hypothetical protein
MMAAGSIFAYDRENGDIELPRDQRPHLIRCLIGRSSESSTAPSRVPGRGPPNAPTYRAEPSR